MIEWDKKFIDTIDVSDYEVETEDGWADITHINKTVQYQVYTVNTTSFSLGCADEHIVIGENHEEIYVKDLTPGDMLITANGIEPVISITISDEYENMYDLALDSDKHTYYTDGILSHNTTLLRLLTLWYVCFESDFEIVIASNKQSTSTKTLRKIKESYKALPMWLKPGIVKWDETCVIFDNGSAIYASATTEDGCRGDSVNMLILDEFAHIKNRMAEEFYTSVYPTISEGATTKIVMISTPNGMSGPYYETWAKAKRKLNSFNAVEILWNEPPNRDEKYKAKVIADFSERKWRQEYECVDYNTTISIINEETGEVSEILIGSLYEQMEIENEK